MKLYGFGPATNPQRVRVFLAEKGLEVPTVEPGVRDGELQHEPYRSMNPFQCVPFLELDDGTVIAESMSICRYLEELHPEPSLFGVDPIERAVIDMWNRRLELDGLLPGGHAVRNKLDLFAGRVLPGHPSEAPQLPEVVARGHDMLELLFGRLEPHLATSPFVASTRFTVADITGFFTVRMSDRLGIEIADRFPNVARWSATLQARPAFQL